MSKSRDIADSAATINYIDNVTSDVQSQLNTLTTAIDNITVTNGSLTKTFVADESSIINLSDSLLAPVVSVTKEVPQTGVTNNNWDVSSDKDNYTRVDSAYNTTLDMRTGLTNSPLITYTGIFKNLSGVDSNAYDIQFKPDGTKMFVYGRTNSRVYQYSLSTPWDVSSATYDSVELNVFDSSGLGLGAFAMSQDGTKVYICAITGQKLYEYTLLTAWDVTSGSLTATQTLTSIGSNMLGMDISADGTKLFLLDWDDELIDVFVMSTPYSITSISDTKTSYAVPEIINVTGLSFSSDGFIVAVSASNGGGTKLGSLSSAFDMSTVTWDPVQLDPSIITGTVNDINIRHQDRFYYMSLTNDRLHQYDAQVRGVTLSLGAGSFASGDLGKTIEANSGQFVLINVNGVSEEIIEPTSYDQAASGDWGMYTISYNAQDDDLQLSGYTDYSTVFDITSASFLNDFDVSSQSTAPVDVGFTPDGTKMFVLDSTRFMYRYSLSIPFDSSSASYDSYSAYFSESENASGFAFSSDGLKIFISNNLGYIKEYALSQPYATATESFTTELNLNSSLLGTTRGLTFNNDGTRLFIVSGYADEIARFDLSTPYQLSSASLVERFSVGGEDSVPQAVRFNTDGYKMYFMGTQRDRVREYNLTAPFDISSPVAGSVFSVSGQETVPYGFCFNPDGSKMYVTGIISDNVNQYELVTTYYPSGYQAAHTTASIDTTYWTDINSMTAEQTVVYGNVYYAISTDDRTTWTVIDNTDGERDIVRNNAGTWQYNSNATYALETWTNGTTNTELDTLAEAMGTTQNQMDKTQLDAVTDPNHIALGNDLDLSIIFNMSSGNIMPSSDGVAINYDANVLNKGAVLGTDYDFDAPASDKVRITALTAGNFKVRVV